MIIRPLHISNELILALLADNHINPPHEVSKGLPPDATIEGIIWNVDMACLMIGSEMWDENQLGQPIECRFRAVSPLEYLAYEESR